MAGFRRDANVGFAQHLHHVGHSPGQTGTLEMAVVWRSGWRIEGGATLSEVGEVTDWEVVTTWRTSSGLGATANANRQALTDATLRIVAGDYEAYWALFDPDVRFHEAACLPYGGTHEGLAATQAAYHRIGAIFSALRSEQHEILAAGDYCCLYTTISFTLAANGRSGVMPVAELFQFRNGKIVDWRVHYFDAALFAELLT
jgi:hypothetical protein